MPSRSAESTACELLISSSARRSSARRSRSSRSPTCDLLGGDGGEGRPGRWRDRGDDLGAELGRANWPKPSSRSGSAAMATRVWPIMKCVSTIASWSCARCRSSFLRDGLAADLVQAVDEGVDRLQADAGGRSGSRARRCRSCRRSAASGASGRRRASASASPRVAISRDRGPAVGQRVELLLGQVAVERVGQVGQHDGMEAERLDQLLDRLDVADGQQRPGEHVHPTPAARGGRTMRPGVGHQLRR